MGQQVVILGTGALGASVMDEPPVAPACARRRVSVSFNPDRAQVPLAGLGVVAEVARRSCGCRGLGRGQHQGGCCLRGIEEFLAWALGLSDVSVDLGRSGTVTAYGFASLLSGGELGALGEAAQWWRGKGRGDGKV